MLHWAAWGVAMDNAPDEVKAIADEVTGHVDEDGLVPILEALVCEEPFREGVPSRDCAAPGQARSGAV